MQKKVLFVITKGTHGGAQRYVLDLVTHLPKEKFEFVVAYGTEGRLVEKLRAAGVETILLPSLARDFSLLSDISAFFEIRACIKKIRPDVVHLNSSKAAGLGALAARLCRIKTIVFTAHGWPFKERRNPIARVVIFFASWCTAVLSTRTIVVSSVDEIISRYMPFSRLKTEYIPLGIEPGERLPRAEAWQQIQRTASIPDGDGARIVTVAELTPNKGVRYGLDAIAGLGKRNVPSVYVIIGAGEEEKKLKEQAVRLGINDRTFFVGFIEDAARYLSAFDVMLLPSLKEGMPYVLLEAAHAKLPVVATSAIDPSFSHMYSGIELVPPGDATALAGALERRIKTGNAEEPTGAPGLRSMLRAHEALYLAD